MPGKATEREVIHYYFMRKSPDYGEMGAEEELRKAAIAYPQVLDAMYRTPEEAKERTKKTQEQARKDYGDAFAGWIKAIAEYVTARKETGKVIKDASLEWVAYIMVAEGQDNEGGKQTEANYSKLLADIEQAADKVWQDIDQLAGQLANVDAVQRPAVCAILADRLGNVLVKRAKTVPVNGD